MAQQEQGSGSLTPAANRALDRGLNRSARSSNVPGETFAFTEAQVKKLKGLITTLKLARKTVMNLAIRYALGYAKSRRPNEPAKVKGFPKKMGEEEVIEEISAETRTLLKDSNLDDKHKEFAIMGINLLYDKLDIEKIGKVV